MCQDLKLSLVEQQNLVSELSSSLEEETQQCAQLKAQFQEQQRQQEAQQAQQQSRTKELQVSGCLGPDQEEEGLPVRVSLLSDLRITM